MGNEKLPEMVITVYGEAGCPDCGALTMHEQETEHYLDAEVRTLRCRECGHENLCGRFG